MSWGGIFATIPVSKRKMLEDNEIFTMKNDKTGEVYEIEHRYSTIIFKDTGDEFEITCELLQTYKQFLKQAFNDEEIPLLCGITFHPH